MNNTAPLAAAQYVPDGGFDLEAVQNQLTDSYVFELTYRTSDGEERTLFVTQESVDQPFTTSAQDIPVFRFSAVEYDQIIEVQLPDIMAINSMPLTRQNTLVRETAIRSMASDVTDGPEMVPISDVFTAIQLAVNHLAIRTEHHKLIFNILQSDAYDDAFRTLSEQIFDLIEQSDTGGEKLVLIAITQYAEHHPGAFDAHIADLISLLEIPSYSEEIVKCLAKLAEDDPSRILDVVPTLATTVDSADVDTKKWVMYVFSKIASTHPEELFPVIDTLSSALQMDEQNLQLNALAALGHITNSYPDATIPLVDDLAELLTSEHAPIRKNAVAILGDIAQEHPTPVINHATAIADCLEDDAADTRRNATITLLRSGEANPSAVKAEHDALSTALNDTDSTVRANACTLIANTHAPVSADRLQTLRDTDPSDRVQEEAARALNRIN